MIINFTVVKLYITINQIIDSSLTRYRNLEYEQMNIIIWMTGLSLMDNDIMNEHLSMIGWYEPTKFGMQE